MLAQILSREPAADTLEISVDGFSNRTIVEYVPCALGNHPIGMRQIRIAAHVVFVGSHATGCVRCYCIGRLFHPGAGTEKSSHVALQVPANDLRIGRA